MNYVTLYSVLSGISNDIGIRITESLARKWAIDAEFGSFDEKGKRVWIDILIVLWYWVS